MLSILTPSYNYGRYIPAAIESVRDQTVPAQHVIMDGGSTDSTLQVLRSAPSNVVWCSEPDSGQSDALNKALALATGDIIGWLNADDYYLPGAFEAAMQVFRQHPDVDVVHGDCVFVDAAGKFVRLGAGYRTPLRVLKNRGCVIPSTATFFRREALGEAPWDPGLKVIMDWDLFLRLMTQGHRFHYIRRALACFRLHGEQVTHGWSDRYSAEHDRVRRRWDAMPSHPEAAQRLGDLEHRLRKLTTGAVLRELWAGHRTQAGRDRRRPEGAAP